MQTAVSFLLVDNNITPLLEESYISAEMQLLYSTAQAYWATFGGVLHLCRDAVVVFYSPSLLGHFWRSLTSLQRCSCCILQPKPIGPLLEESYISAEMQLLYSTAQAYWATFGGVLHLCRDAVVVFYSPSLLGHFWRSLTSLQRCSCCILQPKPIGPLLEEAYISAEMQLLYSTAQAYWATFGGVLHLCKDAVGVFYSPIRLWHFWRRLSSLQRCSWCILLPYPTGPLLEESFISAKMQLVYSTALSDWATFGGIFHLCRDAVVVFYRAF